jgi:site-specific recombinase XerD
MAITAAILNYRRFLKRRNYSAHTIKNYLHTLKQFVVWVDVPIEAVTHKKLLAYLDYLLDRGLQPKTINCHLDSIQGVLPLPHRGRAGGHGPSGEAGLYPTAVPAAAATPAR